MDTKIDQLKQIIPEKYILRQEPMKNHTTFRIGDTGTGRSGKERGNNAPTNGLLPREQ